MNLEVNLLEIKFPKYPYILDKTEDLAKIIQIDLIWTFFRLRFRIAMHCPSLYCVYMARKRQIAQDLWDRSGKLYGQLSMQQVYGHQGLMRS
jgi:hypothetical protein